MDEVVERISGVGESAGQARRLVDSIREGSGREEQGLSRVLQGVNEMQQVTHTTAATAEECAAASEELSAQAEAMRGISRDLTLLVGA
jgi:methyl-accepting chemotaxis protein